MNRLLTCISLVIVTLLQFSAVVHAGPLDDYYLQQFGEPQSAQLQKAVLSVSADVQESATCGMPLKKALRRDWNQLEQSTQKVLAKQLAYPALASEATFTSAAGHFVIHYSTTGTDAPPLLDQNNNGVPDWVETVAATFENVYATYGAKGYRPAPTLPAGSPFNIYLLDLAPQGFYGVTTSDQPAPSANYPNAYTSWMELDNNFTDAIYHPGTYTPLQSLQITAAHEYHHAIQYGYNYYFDTWYAEATSTWMEDELYDGVNQSYSYISNWFTQSKLALDTPVSTTTGGGYGRWIFNRYLSETHDPQGPPIIRSAWEKLASLNPSSSQKNVDGDIRMVPVLESLLSSTTYATTLGTDFFGFAKRVYTRDWATHKNEINMIHVYSPVATYSTYPVNDTVTLPHYSFAYYRFLPPPSSPDNLNITVTGTSGIKATAFIKSSGGIVTEYPFTTVNGTTTSIPYFSSSNEVVLLVANTTDVDNHQASFSTDGTPAPVTGPTIPTPTTSGSSSGGGGCFIATAAYGSYLHPQVELLRHFRDEHLLTNAPGRAFVALYYRCSPPLADFIARHPFLRGVTRVLLTPIIIAVVHPAASAAGLLLALALLYRPLRRRLSGADRRCWLTKRHYNSTTNTTPPASTTRLQTAETPCRRPNCCLTGSSFGVWSKETICCLIAAAFGST